MAWRYVACGVPFTHLLTHVLLTYSLTCSLHGTQGVLYSGNDRVHGLKWQGIMLPNGIMPFPFGPICGSNHDAEMLRRSGLFQALDHIMQHAAGTYALFGDLAYPNHRYMHRPFEGAAPQHGQTRRHLCPHPRRAAALPSALCHPPPARARAKSAAFSHPGAGLVAGSLQLGHERRSHRGRVGLR